LIIAIVAYSSTGGKLKASVSAFIARAPGGAATAALDVSILRGVVKNLTSHMSIPDLISDQPRGVINASSNWAGYVAMADTGKTASFVSANWTMPNITCASTPESGALFWVGLGGISDAPLQQIGTMAFCTDGQLNYSIWYQAVPTDPHLIVLNTTTAPSPGQQVSASVSYSSSTDQFTYSIAVGTQAPITFSQSYANVTAPASAEWVVEPPFSPIGPMVMANFGSINFSPGTATIGKLTGGTGVFGRSSDSYLIRTEYECADSIAKAAPGQIASSAMFPVAWHAGGTC
jgi:hypothetical protein